MSDDDKLAPCPRCGQEADGDQVRLLRTTYEGEPSYYITCTNCGLEEDFGMQVAKLTAIHLWNEMSRDTPGRRYLNPDWKNTSRVHDWRNYINDELRGIWGSFTPEQKRVIAGNAEDIASREHWD